MKGLDMKTDYLRKEEGPTTSCQIGGTHYMDMAIQPVEFIHRNNIGFIEGCCIKYLCRWRNKGGIEDLRKVIHYCELLIQMEKDNQKRL